MIQKNIEVINKNSLFKFEVTAHKSLPNETVVR